MERIERFQGKYRFLSNFVPTGKGFSVEKYYQAFKALSTGRLELREEILRASSPSKAKKLAEGLPRPENAVGYMEDLVREKFRFDPILGRLLLETGEVELVEGNWWHDVFWGVCDGSCAKYYGHTPQGENHLGEILMKVRGEIREKVKEEK